MYKLNNIYNEELQIIGTTETITRISDNAHIPLNPDNSDYQQYLKWVAEGNTPQPEPEPEVIVKTDRQKTIEDIQKQLDDLKGAA